MASLTLLFAVVLCVFTAEAFPSAKRGEHAFVVYRMPPRCVAAPKNDVCDIDYKVQNFGAEKIEEIVSAFRLTKNTYQNLFPDPDAQCPRLVLKLLCQSYLPQCLPRARLFYGNRDQLFRKIEKECVLDNLPELGKHIVKQLKPLKLKSGIQRDPLAPHLTFKCTDVPQDPDKKCPKPEHPMMVNQIGKYYENIRNVTREMEKEKEGIPEECYNMAFNVFACSYAFCSDDRKKLLMKTTRDDCWAIQDCLTRHQALDKEKEEFFQKTCPKYPEGDDDGSAEPEPQHVDSTLF